MSAVLSGLIISVITVPLSACRGRVYQDESTTVSAFSVFTAPWSWVGFWCTHSLVLTNKWLLTYSALMRHLLTILTMTMINSFIPACHTGERGSIPRRGAPFFITKMYYF